MPAGAIALDRNGQSLDCTANELHQLGGCDTEVFVQHAVDAVAAA